jgi:signal recognition particle subunit SEC65
MKRRDFLHAGLALGLGVPLLTGCGNSAIQRRDGRTTSRAFSVNNLAKSDIDMALEIAQREVMTGLQRLAVKLYKRNPREFQKVGVLSVEAAVGRIFDHWPKWRESGLAGVDWAESLRLAFSEAYAGDRVHAFMLALTVMVMASYGHRTEFFMKDEVSAQSLYNSARNLEVAAWKLATARLPEGGPYLYSNSLEETVQNLSFEREFGKLMAQQDMMALLIEDKSNRTINRVILNVASFILLPV